MKKNRINNMAGAPDYIRKWWSRTGLVPALCRLVENGASWENAHARLKDAYQAWFDQGHHGQNPLLRLSNRVIRDRILEDANSGQFLTKYHEIDGHLFVAITGPDYGSSYVPTRPKVFEDYLARH